MCWFDRALLVFCVSTLAVASAKADEFSTKVLPFLESHCLDCHDGDEGKPKGGFDLFPFASTADARANPKTFLRIRDALHFREMPPENKKQPAAAEREMVLDWIQAEIVGNLRRNAGPPMRRRLTRLEYNNTVRDLLGLQTDVFTFPERLVARRDYYDPSEGKMPDKLDIFVREYGARMPTLLKIANLPGDNKAEHGFANQGDSLNITPLLLERYVSVATEIVTHEDFAVESAKLVALTGVQPRPRSAPSQSRGNRTGIFPAKVSGDYAPVGNIKADAPGNSDQAWLFKDHIAAAYELGQGGVFQHPGQKGARVPGKGGVIRAAFGRNGEKALLINPTEDLWFADFGTAHETSPPANIANGNKGQKQFRLGLKLDGVREDVGITGIGVVVLSRSKMSSGPVTLTAHFSSGETAPLTDQIAPNAGEDNTFFSWQAPPGEKITDVTVDGSQFSGDYVLLDDLGFITGKIATPEDKAPVENLKSEVRDPKVENPNPREEFVEFMERAFRGPVSEKDADVYFGVYQEALAAGQAKEDALAEAVRAVLSSPRFLFIVEKSEGRLSGYEIANRLSYFLWASMPDELLLAAAKAGKLQTSAEIEAQVRRMLRDPKSKELSDSFAYQWLKLNVLLGSQPDRKRYANFYSGPSGKVTMAAPLLLETLLLFETVLIENRPISDLIDPDFTWLNPALIKFYGYEDEFAAQLAESETIDKGGRKRRDNGQWFRCQLPDRKRGGVLCMGSTLTLTSLPLRTSPVYRGAWVSEVVFNRAPPPPPAAVDELGADDAEMQEAGQTLRQKLEAHRDKAACAGCHSRMDPLGFPLENFDGIGQWRESYGSFPVDAGGTLMREFDYKGIVGFKDALKNRQPDFHRGFARHLLTYALGRKLETSDEPTIEKLAAVCKDKGLQDLIFAIATSDPFTQVRTN